MGLSITGYCNRGGVLIGKVVVRRRDQERVLFRAPIQGLQKAPRKFEKKRMAYISVAILKNGRFFA